jgi:hypothetical protein
MIPTRAEARAGRHTAGLEGDDHECAKQAVVVDIVTPRCVVSARR